MARMNESRRCCTKVGRWTTYQRIASFPRTLFREREGHMSDYPTYSGTEFSPRYSQPVRAVVGVYLLYLGQL